MLGCFGHAVFGGIALTFLVMARDGAHREEYVAALLFGAAFLAVAVEIRGVEHSRQVSSASPSIPQASSSMPSPLQSTTIETSSSGM